MSSKEVAHALEGGRFMVPAWNEQLVHAQPQSWFVWDADGSVACGCVVAFERLGQLTSLRVNQRKGGGATSSPSNRHSKSQQSLGCPLSWRNCITMTSSCIAPPIGAAACAGRRRICGRRLVVDQSRFYEAGS